MLSQIIAWSSSHSVVVTAVVGIACLLCPSPIKWQQMGFTFSQISRKILGKKGEEKLEEIADNFVKGMHSDNEVKK